MRVVWAWVAYGVWIGFEQAFVGLFYLLKVDRLFGQLDEPEPGIWVLRGVTELGTYELPLGLGRRRRLSTGYRRRLRRNNGRCCAH